MKFPKLKINPQQIIDFVALLLIYSFLCFHFSPRLLFSSTITAGGDTPSHYYSAWYLKENLLSHFKLIGWDQGWFAGYPLFQFYFLPIFLIIAFFSYLIPLQVAFKIGTVLGIFLLPLSAYFLGRNLKLKFPGPLFFSLFTLPFLFNEGNSMWGGNIPSTLAGEFSYSFSLALAVFFLGFLYQGFEKKKYLLLNSLLLALIILSHAYTALWVIGAPLFFLLTKSKKTFLQNLKYLLSLWLLAFLLTAFWTIPGLAKAEFTTAYNHPWVLAKNESILPLIFWPFLILSLGGFLLSLWFQIKEGLYLIFLLGLALMLTPFVPFLGGSDIRLIPFAQISLMFLAAYGLWGLINLGPLKKVKLPHLESLVVMISLLTICWSQVNISYLDFWIWWNYSGLEAKSGWSAYRALNQYLKENGQNSRVVFEHSYQNDSAGSPRIFESLPLFAQTPTLEGLHMNSSATAPFVFYLQALISKEPSCPFWFRWPCESYNPQRALPRLKLFNVSRIITVTPLKKIPGYQLEKTFGLWHLYQVQENENKYVSIPKYEPVIINDKNWKTTAYQWFKNDDLLDVPLIFEKNAPSVNLAAIKKIPLSPQGHIKEEKINSEGITFKTTALHQPHLIKISYSPNFGVEGAEKIYLASPSFMLVYPNQEEVTIFWQKRWPDYLGQGLTFLGLIILSLLIVKKLKQPKSAS